MAVAGQVGSGGPAASAPRRGVGMSSPSVGKEIFVFLIGVALRGVKDLCKQGAFPF